MCVVSMIGDNFSKRIQDDEYWKRFFVPQKPYVPSSNQYPGTIEVNLNNITRQEFEVLKREIEQLKKLLQDAIEYDKKNNEPHCEIDEKVAMIKMIAKAFNIDLSEIFKK